MYQFVYSQNKFIVLINYIFAITKGSLTDLQRKSRYQILVIIITRKYFDYTDSFKI